MAAFYKIALVAFYTAVKNALRGFKFLLFSITKA